MSWESTWVIAAAAAVIGILSGMGLGSAGLFVLYLTALAGMGQTEAQGLNLIFYLCSAGASLCLHASGRRIPLWMIRYLVCFAIVGVIPGVFLADILNADLLRRLFGGMLVATGIYTLFTQGTDTRKARNPKK